MPLADLIPTLQLAIGPVILISGVGLILLNMTNRFGRIIDRTRQLAQAFRASTGEERERAVAELQILARRAKILRTAIALSGVGVLLAAILVITLFLGALFELRIAGGLVTLFTLCLVSLIGSLVLFIIDVNMSLRALWLEIPPEVREH